MKKLMMSEYIVCFCCARGVSSIEIRVLRACRIAWHPEACNFVIEGVPFQPYGFLPSHFNIVEANMRLRREQVQKLLSEQSDCEFILNIAAFPG